MSSSRAPRNTISQDSIVAAAMVMLDEQGVAALTTRKLAKKLGVSVMAIYHHIPSKDDLLRTVVEKLFTDVALPDVNGHWRTELEARSRTLRTVLVEHPWSLALMETQTQPGPQSLVQHEAVLELLRSSGFSVRAAAHAFAILDAFVYGFAMQESQLGSIGLDERPEELAQGMDFSSAPRIAEMAQMYMTADEYPYAESFDVGLKLTLDGLAQLREVF